MDKNLIIMKFEAFWPNAILVLIFYICMYGFKLKQNLKIVVNVNFEIKDFAVLKALASFF